MSISRKLLASAANWGCVEVEKSAMLLFVQKFRELLLHTTSVTAKPMFASPLSVAREIFSIITLHAKIPHSSTEANIKNLVQEFEHVLSQDRIAKAAIGDRLDQILTNILCFTDSRDQIEAAQFLIGRFSVRKYTSECGKRIIQIIEGGGREKGEMLSLAEGFISAIKEAGYPTQTIYHLFNVAFFDYERKPMTARARLEEFFANFDFVQHNYNVFFGLSEIADKVTDTFKSIAGEYWALGSNECNEFLSEVLLRNRRFFDQHEYQGIVKFKEISALDPQSARVQAERRLRLLDDLLRFSVHGRRFVVQNQALVMKAEGARYVNSNRPKAPVLLVPHDSDNGHDGLADLASALRRTQGSSTNRFVRAIELHGTALSAQEDESQLLNLWIALETLFVSGRSGSKIKEIIDSVTPYVLASWNAYLLGEIWEKIEAGHIYSWNESVKSSPELLTLPGNIQFLKAVSIKSYKAEMSAFLITLDSDPLLRYRIFQCINWAQNASSIRDEISKVKQKIVNDINRIYRTRNQIVHIGGARGNMSDIVQLAHYYLDLVLVLLSMMLGTEDGCQSIEQANLEVRIKMESHLKKLDLGTKNGLECDASNYSELLFGRALLD